MRLQPRVVRPAAWCLLHSLDVRRSLSVCLTTLYWEQTDVDTLIDLLQWPAMAASLAAAYLVASSQKRHRRIGFWVFLVSNALWIAWGLHDEAYALIALQVGLAAMNVRGVNKASATTKAS